ncbi:MAG: peroxiredoxin [Candidatus Poribacteria bacterium]|nr:MAG: peroxiredoxin [Candidatus Poribacteria bacterium]
MPTVGEPAPDFTAVDQDGRTVRLSELRGKNVVLYFYPRDDTPGCTKEACGFRDAMERIAATNTVVLGVSPDGPESHRRFIEKHHLNFSLLCDPEHRIAELYEAYGEKQFYGQKRMGVLRKTYLIDAQGRIARVWPRVRPEGHAEEVLQAIEELGDS